jgi:hypothetical protein
MTTFLGETAVPVRAPPTKNAQPAKEWVPSGMDILGEEHWEVGLVLACSSKDFGKVNLPIGMLQKTLHQGLDLWVTFIVPPYVPVVGRRLPSRWK